MAAQYLRSGRVLSDDELASAAAEALQALGYTHAEAAERLGLKSRTQVTMALNPKTHGGRGHSVRVGILALAGYAVEGPSYRLRRIADG